MDALLKLLMGPWTTYILWILRTGGALRFGGLKQQVAGISAKVLTARLRALEAAGIIYRDYEPTVPPAVTYGLTPRGRDLDAVLDALNDVALRCRRRTIAAPAHRRAEGRLRSTDAARWQSDGDGRALADDAFDRHLAAVQLRHRAR